MRIYVLPCDGIGPEIIDASMGVLEAVNNKHNLGLTFDFDEIGFVSLKKYGTTLRDEVLEKARGYDGIILGTSSHMDYPPPEKGGRNPSAAFRVGLDLYANVRPARSRVFLNKGAKNMDLVIMREATEGFYPDRNMHKGWAELMPTPGMALSIRKITDHACERIARRSFELAMKRRKKVTAVHKANVFHVTDGLFLQEVRKVAKDFPEVELNEVIVDAMAAHLVRDPSRFDVIVATNFYGDILSDLASELSGSLGLAGSMMASDIACCAQAQHGSAPDIEGQDRANPTSMMLSVAMLLQWLGDHHQAARFSKAASEIDAAVDRVLADPASRTRDLGGNLGCKTFGERVAAAVSSA
jgi:3-isopropylmalate dehydrogenase